MTKMTIAIIGAGNGGRAFAVYLSKAGYNVNLGFRTSQNIKEIYLSQQIFSEGEIEGVYNVNIVSNNYKKILKKAQIILMVVPASVHSEIIYKIAPYLIDGQIIILNPGRTWGAIEIYNKITQLRPNLKIIIAEAQSLLFTSRKLIDYGVSILSIKNQIDICCYPESGNKIIQPIIQDIFPQFTFVDDIMQTSLNNIGAIIHPVTVLFNAGPIFRGDEFLFYQEGVIPPVARVIERIDMERCKIMERMGLNVVTFLDWVTNVYGIKCTTYFEAFQSIMSYKTIKAPTSLEIRYLYEDVPTGLVPLSSLGKYLGIKTPAIDSIITLIDTLLSTNFSKHGRTLEKSGIPINLLEKRILYREIEDFEPEFSL